MEDLRQALRIDPGFEDAKQNLNQALQDWDVNDKQKITANNLWFSAKAK